MDHARVLLGAYRRRVFCPASPADIRRCSSYPTPISPAIIGGLLLVGLLLAFPACAEILLSRIDGKRKSESCYYGSLNYCGRSPRRI
jgi:hypothetical protein